MTVLCFYVVKHFVTHVDERCYINKLYFILFFYYCNFVIYFTVF